MAKQKNIDTVAKLTQDFKNAKSLVFADYRGMTHKQLEDLRRALKKQGGKFVIAKNSLLLRALGAILATTEELKTEFSGPTGALIATADEIAPLRELSKTIKSIQLPTIKFGFLGSNKISKEQVSQLAALPSKEVLIAQLLGSLQSPLYGLHNALTWNMRKLVYALDAVKVKKSS